MCRGGLMDRFNLATVVRVVGALFKDLEDLGLEVRYMSAGMEADALFSTADRNRGIPQMIFRNEAERICPDVMGGFWLFGVDAHGIGVIQAFSGLDFGEGSLAEHLTRYGEIYLVDGIPAVDPNPVVRTGAAHRLTGRGCYFGETWFRPERAEVPGYRKLGLTSRVLRLAMGLAYLTFRPSFMYGFAEEQVARRGYTLRYGHFQTYPHGGIWVRPDGTVDDLWLTFTDALDYGDLFGEFARDRKIPQHL